MKILETAIFSQNPRYLKEILAPLTVKKESILNIDTYRYEVDEDFIILLYDFKSEVKIPEEVLEHLKYHLAGLLIVVDETISQLPGPDNAFIDKLAQNIAGKPTVMAVRMDTSKMKSLNRDIFRSGFYLAENGRVLFWNPKVPDSLTRIWKMLWTNLRTEEIVTE